MPEVAEKVDDRIFVSFRIKDLPKDTQKRHRLRMKKILKNEETNRKLREEGEEDLVSIMRTKGEK